MPEEEASVAEEGSKGIREQGRIDSEKRRERKGAEHEATPSIKEDSPGPNSQDEEEEASDEGELSLKGPAVVGDAARPLDQDPMRNAVRATQ